MTKTSIRKDFLNFIKSPAYLRLDEHTIFQRLIALFKVFVISSLLQLVPGLLLSAFEYFGLHNGIEMISTKIYEFEKIRNSGYTPYIVVLGVLIMPVLEEIAYRLPLKRFELKSIVLALSVACGLLIIYFLSQYLWWPKGNLMFFLTNLLYLISIIGILYLLFNQFGGQISKLKNYWNQNPSRIFYLSASLFALMHLFNLNIEANDLIFLPLLLTTFLISGIALGYLRIRLGLSYSILMHVIINGLSFAFR